MIAKRLCSIAIDFFPVLVIAYIAMKSGLDFQITLVSLFLLTVGIEIIVAKGRTVGMGICKIFAKNRDGHEVSSVVLFIYHIAFALVLFIMFSNEQELLLRFVLPIALITPFKYNGMYNSPLDFLFRIHWTKD